MRKSLDVAWAAGHQPKAGVVCLTLALAIPLFAAGCGKNSAPPPAPISSADAAQLQPLNQAIMGWVMQHQRAPTNFDEFAASTDIKIPPPPPGKKYVINSHGLINLVNAN
jgi:hypothetical protein